MEITLQNTGELTATVKINLLPADYNEPVNKVLKDYQRKASIPGFRPGHVPFGMIKKLYGSAIFADEVNKLVSEKLYNYIRDEKLQVLGQPLPNTELTESFDWNENSEINFYFDLGFSPEFDLKLDESVTIPYYSISVTEEQVDRYIAELRKRYSKTENPELAQEGDILLGQLTELDAEGNPKEGGISKQARIALDKISDEKVKKSLTGTGKDASCDFNPLTATGNTTEVAYMLGIKKEEAENLNSDFRFSVVEVERMIEPALGPEFYNEVFPGQDIQEEETFRLQVKKDAEKTHISDSDHLFMHHMHDILTEQVPVNLPVDFLKRWLLASNEGKLSVEEIEKDFDKYVSAMKWQLIENRIILNNHIQVDDQDMRDHVKDAYFPGWRGMENGEDFMKRLDEMADSFIKRDADQAQRLMDVIYERKIMEVVKTKVSLNIQEITYDEFLKLDAEKH